MGLTESRQRQYELHKGTLIALHDKVPQSNIVVSVRQVRPTDVGDPKQVSSAVNSNIVNSKGIASDVVDSDPRPSKIVLDSLELDQGPLGHVRDYSVHSDPRSSAYVLKSVDSDRGSSIDFVNSVNSVQPHCCLTTPTMDDKMNAKESKIFSDRDRELPTDIVDIINSYRGCERRVKAAVESPDDLQLESVGHLIRTNPDDYKLWHRRKMIIGRKTNATCISSELHFTKEILSMHPDNKHCWSYRQWFLEAFQGRQNKIEISDVMLEGHTHNEFAWTEMRSVHAESDFAVDVIRKEPENEYPWIHLRSLYKEVGFDSKKLDKLFEFALDDSGITWGPKSRQVVRQGSIYPISVEINIVINRKKYTNALDTILDLICCGYEVAEKVDGLIRSISPINSVWLFRHIYAILSLASPLGNWKRGIDRAMRFRGLF
ncbi:CAAX geranylgeranyltransferase alpha subunit [Orobanche hederae]